MAEFLSAVITEAGIALSTDILTGDRLEFTKLVTGAGTYTEKELIRTNLQKATSLRDKRQEFNFGIIKKATDNCVLLKTVITNRDLTESYRMSEIGIYAKKKGEEGDGILYSISIATEADYFPLYNGMFTVDIIDEHYVTVSDATSVTIQIDSNSTVMLEDFLKFQDEVYQEFNKIRIVVEVDLSALERRVEECFQSVSNGKMLIASTLTGKGVETEATATFETLNNNIELLDNTVGTATADNISLNKVAWVNHEKITGNGADVNEAYRQGYLEGYEAVQTNAKIVYKYHSHSGNPVTGGGCYTIPVYHEHDDSCYNICTITTSACHGGGSSDSWGVRCPVTVTHSQCGAPETQSTRYHRNSDNGGSHEGPSTTTHRGTLKCTKEGAIVGYKLGCGKAEGAIESAVITFD